MMSDIWHVLQSGFPHDAIEWRVVDINEGSSQAQVKPQLRYQAVIDRLNQIGKTNWSNRFISISENTVVAELSIAGIVKSRVKSLRSSFINDTILTKDAFIEAAALFDILCGCEEERFWVDYDAEAGEIVFEPELEIKEKAKVKQTAIKVEAKAKTKEVIDRLVERLGEEGLGLEAAKMLTQYGGYGNNSENAKELYGKLRELLMGKTKIGSN